MVLKELERLNSYTHGSPFVILPVRHFALIFNYFRKSNGFIYYLKYRAKQGHLVGNDYLSSRSCLLRQNLEGFVNWISRAPLLSYQPFPMRIRLFQWDISSPSSRPLGSLDNFFRYYNILTFQASPHAYCTPVTATVTKGSLLRQSLNVTAGAATALATLHMYRNVERYGLKHTKRTDCA